MLSFATEFPIQATHNSSQFLVAIREWLLGSPHTQLVADDLAGIEAQNEWSKRKSSEVIDVLRITTKAEDAAAVRYVKNHHGLEWSTTIVFSRQLSSSWIGIRLSCESQHPAARLPPAKKPVVVRTLLNRLAGSTDGELMVQSVPLRLDNADISIAARCISGQAGCRMPVVYVSAPFAGEQSLDVDSLATKLAGMAHVVVEPDRPFSYRLRIEVSGQNVYGGTVGVYWPDGGGRRSFFIGPDLDTPAEVEDAVVQEVQSALANRRPLVRCTWAAVQAAVSRQAVNALKEQGETQFEKYSEEFDKELKAKEERIADAENEIARLQGEVRRYEARRPMDSGLWLATGPEQDLYGGELLSIVRDALVSAGKGVRKDSRRQHVLLAIAEANPSTDEASSKREQLKALLRGYRTMDAKIRRALLELGFEVTEEGKHYKLVFQGDDRYTFTLPKSGSDGRGGLNAANTISSLMF